MNRSTELFLSLFTIYPLYIYSGIVSAHDHCIVKIAPCSKPHAIQFFSKENCYSPEHISILVYTYDPTMHGEITHMNDCLLADIPANGLSCESLSSTTDTLYVIFFYIRDHGGNIRYLPLSDIVQEIIEYSDGTRHAVYTIAPPNPIKKKAVIACTLFTCLSLYYLPYLAPLIHSTPDTISDIMTADAPQKSSPDQTITDYLKTYHAPWHYLQEKQQRHACSLTSNEKENKNSYDHVVDIWHNRRQEFHRHYIENVCKNNNDEAHYTHIDDTINELKKDLIKNKRHHNLYWRNDNAGEGLLTIIDQEAQIAAYQQAYNTVPTLPPLQKR